MFKTGDKVVFKQINNESILNVVKTVKEPIEGWYYVYYSINGFAECDHIDYEFSEKFRLATDEEISLGKRI